MQTASKFNPLSYLVDAERTLFSGNITSATVAWGWIAALITAALGLTIGIRTMLRSAA
jgi:ABC-2 type transport system permease protein